ncbi:MAG: 3-hydroxyacyl-CoA dehydrogenase NAD-binding domain-containing protein [Gemmatimonadota bacterium]
MADAMAGRRQQPLELTLSVKHQGVAWIHIRPRLGSTIPFAIETLRELERLLGDVERLANGDAVQLLILTTAAPHPHLVGYDLDEVRSMREEEVVAWSHEAQRVLRGLETLPVPSVAAIQGEWLGGAAELALACSYRVGVAAPGTRLGFPHTRLGFLPAWGGTVRLPRLIGLQTALRLVLTGDPLGATEAVEIGLLDGELSPGDFELRVERFAQRRVEGARTRRRRPLRRRLLDDTAPGRRLLAARAARRHLAEAESDEAARVALELMSETLALPLERAFAREAAAAGRLILSSDVRGRLHSQRFTERARLRLPIGTGDFESAAVLGAGQTGSDFAHLFASAGAQVRLKDVSRELVRTGVSRARARIRWEQSQHLFSDGQARRRAVRIRGVTAFGGFGTLDLILATSDGPDSDVRRLLTEAERHVQESCLLAFCDWTTSPTGVQRSLNHPERVAGLVASLPLEIFPLLEIVPGALTSPEVVSAARRLARRLSRTGVVVSDQTPTPGLRLLGTYLGEALRLLEEGATVGQVDKAAESFGFFVGPFRRMDAIGGRRTLEMISSLGSAMERRVEATPLLTRWATEERTFYRYRDGRPGRPDPDLPEGVSPGGEAVSKLIRRRLVLALINEAARIVEEGCVSDPGDLEVISIHGMGFPRERGGILFHAQSLGMDRLVDDLGAAAHRDGVRYAPAGLLRDLASAGRDFFGGAPSARLDTTPGG